MMIYWIMMILVLNRIECLDMAMIINGEPRTIYSNDQLDYKFNRTVFDSAINCENGQFYIIQLLAGSKDKIGFQFTHSTIQDPLISLRGSRNSFIPIITQITKSSVTVDPNCPSDINNDNYYNQIIMTMHSQDNKTGSSYEWAFLLNCDSGNRHKKFQIGYLVIALINASIIIGVALHSRVWSIRYKGGSIYLVVTWKIFIFIMGILTAGGVAFYFYARSVFADANQLLRIIGIVIGSFYAFLCCDEVFYLFSILKMKVYSVVRICDLLSLFITILIVVLASLIDNWIIANILAVCICVGSIKLLKFRTLRESIICMAIYSFLVTGLAIVFHYTLTRSYNDYASELSSPFFILIPDLVENVYKKCSWLPVFDIIVPGIMLAYLREYDVSYNTSAVWGGVYTVVGNVSFLLATILWILIQAVYPFSVPFCLVTYPILCASILLISYKRNQFKTLWKGFFTMSSQNEVILIDQTPKTFEDLLRDSVIDAQKYRQSQSDRDSKEQIPLNQPK